MRVGLMVAVATAITIGAVALTGGGGSADLFVATNGSDSNSCTSIASPCLTLNGAFQKISDTAAHTIQVACGDYGAQTISVNSARTASTNYVTFQPASGGVCWNQTDEMDVSASYVKIMHVAYGGGITVHQDNQVAPIYPLTTNMSGNHIIVDGQNGGYFEFIGPGSNLTVQNSDVGNCKANTIGAVQVECDPGTKTPGGTPPSNVSILNTKIHDISYTTGNPDCGSGGVCHVNGMGTAGVNGMTLDGVMFYNTAISNLRIQNRTSTAAQEHHNITIENSWFDGQIQVDTSVDGLVIRFNSFSDAPDSSTSPCSGTDPCWNATITCGGDGNVDDGNPGITRGKCGTNTNHALIYGNIIASPSVASGVAPYCWDYTDAAYNIIIPHSKSQVGLNCNSSNSTVLATYPSAAVIPYTTDPLTVGGPLPNNGVPNYDMTNTSWTNNNFVNCTTLAGLGLGMSCPSTDYHGTSRSSTTDAGAVQQ